MPQGAFDTAEIDIPCPHCGHKTAKAIGWVKEHSDLTCSGCNRHIRLDRDQILGELGKVDASVDRIKRSYAKFKKR